MSQYIVHFTSKDATNSKDSFSILQYEVNGPDFPNTITPALNLDGTTNPPKTSLLLYGRGMPNYGERIQENLLHVMENFWNDEPPVLATGGQMWFDNVDGVLRVFHQDLLTPANSKWVSVDRVFADTVPPVDEGPGMPRQLATGQLWFDLTDNQLKVFDGVSWISVADQYLPLAGGTLTGDLTLAGDPTSALHAATKQYVDNGVAADLATHTLDADLHLTAHQNSLLDDIESMYATLTAMELGALDDFNTGGGSVQTQIDAKLALTGGTLTGFLFLNADPTSALHAATKQYVDSAVGGGGNWSSDGFGNVYRSSGFVGIGTSPTPVEALDIITTAVYGSAPVGYTATKNWIRLEDSTLASGGPIDWSFGTGTYDTAVPTIVRDYFSLNRLGLHLMTVNHDGHFSFGPFTSTRFPTDGGAFNSMFNIASDNTTATLRLEFGPSSLSVNTQLTTFVISSGAGGASDQNWGITHINRSAGRDTLHFMRDAENVTSNVTNIENASYMTFDSDSGGSPLVLFGEHVEMPSGETTTDFSIANAPTVAAHATRKDYVDNGDSIGRSVVTSPGWVFGNNATVPTYDVGSHRLWVFVNGIKWLIVDGYLEIDPTTIQWQDTIPAGVKVEYLVVGKEQ